MTQDHFPRVTTDATASATDTAAFLKALNEKEGTSGGAGDDGPSLVTSKNAVKVILLGDSAVGKSKLVERFLMDGYQPQQLSTFALTLFRYNFKHPDGREVAVDFWPLFHTLGIAHSSFDRINLATNRFPGSTLYSESPYQDTAGQERFNNLHPSYFYKAHACVMAFDVTRKVTYKNLDRWYAELQEYCPGIPTIVVANKIDVDYRVTERTFAFPEKRGLPFCFVSASDGTNVVKVFQQAIMMGLKHKENPGDDFLTQALELLGE